MGQMLDSNASRVQYDKDSENGFTINGQYIPEEILAEILLRVDNKTLLQCHLVCKEWNILIRSYVWRKKVEMVLGKLLPFEEDIPWQALYKICEKRPFRKNLVRNHSGEYGVRKHWRIIHQGGDRWKVEDSPKGAPPLPNDPVFEGKQYCFVTSYDICMKQQIIDLASEGLTPELMDSLQPPITVSEWYSSRFDCPATYECMVSLVGKDHQKIEMFTFRDDLEGDRQAQWFYKEHTFRGYGPGVRKVAFSHIGTDKSFWAGHYGAKMAGACVRVDVPSKGS